MSSEYVVLDGEGLKHLKLVVNLYLRRPEEHPYLLHDLTYELSRSRAYLRIESGEVKAYLLIWRGLNTTASILWGDCSSLIKLIPRNHEMIVQSPPKVADEVINYLSMWGGIKSVNYLDMAVDEERFKPFKEVRAVRLNPGNPKHVAEFSRIRRESGVNVGEHARELIAKQRPYGVFINDELVSIALAYVRMPEVWVVGGVYTKPRFRGRGYAKAVTSAVTEEAVNAGAKAVLHVRRDNEAALKVYRRLGYRVISEKVWIFYKPREVKPRHPRAEP